MFLMAMGCFTDKPPFTTNLLQLKTPHILKDTTRLSQKYYKFGNLNNYHLKQLLYVRRIRKY